MSLFLGTHQNKLDAKGRVSVPASFRAALRKEQSKENNPLIFRPSHKMPCIEGWPLSIFSELTNSLNSLDLFSEEHDDIATTLYAEAWPIDSDREGRILLPDILKEHANLTDAVTFMGLGTIFQIWEPSAAAERCKTARQKVQQKNPSITPQSNKKRIES
ncbi:division/cell wall cluster transcriptional repressor MraZ [Commensalibacter communis]|uniref:division/cell wall cluster transcriptional repressor MraZ n=1 Tax=Commensalibacter communis TaxID=2972786 RepID=UPI0022FF51C7|nr:division/cell wall cluster transcriptional repressor MraZ [Commensalibacter communis]CAI3923433.1 DNA-binding transcriptional regulator and inhibitor of RsmH methyltransferase activity (MraZ) (PDB:1N0E) [Commensalibacter communis]CAI3931231.1 DNA-binding transcriptional regulator and inhibitor of RsmH methyltransferase activity (MraZ) (PDB:1N0E) [Commensalibacter communis]